MVRNYYRILEISENATTDDIKRAYRRLALKYHPDINKYADAHEKFCEITEAYEFLMHHWPQYISRYADKSAYEQKYKDYHSTEDFEQFRQKAREKAQQQAKMRYEKFKKQHDAFQESGINDIALLLNIMLRIISIPLFICLFLLPIVLSLLINWTLIFLALLMWPFAGIIAWYIYDNRKNYLRPGNFYYSPKRIKSLYTNTHPSEQNCYYCPYKKADSKAFKLDLLRLKDVKFRSGGGFRLHQVNYLNDSISVMVPRSRKAFVIHSLNILIKVLSILICLLFLDISSIVWRIIAGFFMGGIISSILLIISRTRSNVSYLISYSSLIRITVWIAIISIVSRFFFKPFDIITNDFIYFAVTATVIFDSFLMQLINLVLGKSSSKPVFRQFPEVIQRFNEGYCVYNDIPVISFVYPLFKWIFG
jgi:curved DNA-binding protein CbpA